jgi:hypothetical protein
MGVTIHFEGKLKNSDSLTNALSAAARFSENLHWPIRIINEPHVTLQRVRGEQDWEYVSPVNGLEILPHEDSEPFRLEFDRDLFVQEYTKTQFAPIEIHLQIVELLQLLEPFFDELKVIDEGDYFETADLRLLANHRDSCLETLNDYLAQSPTNTGPIRLENGRILDLLLSDDSK